MSYYYSDNHELNTRSVYQLYHLTITIDHKLIMRLQQIILDLKDLKECVGLIFTILKSEIIILPFKDDMFNLTSKKLLQVILT